LALDEQNVEALKDQGGPALCDISAFNAKYHTTKVQLINKFIDPI
jgi:hypothetical protein